MRKTWEPFCDLPIESGRLLLRPYRTEDFAAVYPVVNRAEISETMPLIPHPYPPERLRWWFRKLDVERNAASSLELGVFLRAGGQYVGHCGLIHLNRDRLSASLAYFIDPDCWGNGYAGEAIQALLPTTFRHYRLERLAATCISDNYASRRVLEKGGFCYEGTARRALYHKGKFHDVAQFSMLREEYAENARSAEKKVDKPDQVIL